MEPKKFDFIFFDKTPFNEKDFAHLFLKKWTKKTHEEYSRETARKIVQEACKVFHPDWKPAPPKPVKVPIAKPSHPAMYNASYEPLSASLQIRIQELGFELHQDPWKIFFKHATFNEILGHIEPGEGEKTQLEQAINAEKHNRPEEILELIRDQPFYLFDERKVLTLVRVLEEARWSSDKEEASNARTLLSKHLIPRRPRGKTPVRGSMNDAREIMIRLAKHLSQKYEQAGKHGLTKYGRKKTCEVIQSLTRESKEYRISNLTLENISALIFNPTKFVDAQIDDYFGVSKKTRDRRKGFIAR